MRFPREDPGFERIATLDIETTHFKADLGEIVSIGIGVHNRSDPARDPSYETFHRDGNGEANLVQKAISRLDDYGVDGLVSYKGVNFDVSFIEDRLTNVSKSVELPEIMTDTDLHLDLYVDREIQADETGVKWPNLEDCLESYGYPQPTTIWQGEKVTNTRFGEELGPAYLQAIEADQERASELAAVIDHYLTTDLEANFAIYYSDIGENFEPRLLLNSRTF